MKKLVFAMFFAFFSFVATQAAEMTRIDAGEASKLRNLALELETNLIMLLQDAEEAPSRGRPSEERVVKDIDIFRYQTETFILALDHDRENLEYVKRTFADLKESSIRLSHSWHALPPIMLNYERVRQSFARLEFAFTQALMK